MLVNLTRVRLEHHLYSPVDANLSLVVVAVVSGSLCDELSGNSGRAVYAGVLALTLDTPEKPAAEIVTERTVVCRVEV